MTGTRRTQLRTDEGALAPLLLLLLLAAILGLGWYMGTSLSGAMRAVTWTLWAGFVLVVIVAYKKLRA